MSSGDCTTLPACPHGTNFLGLRRLDAAFFLFTAADGRRIRFPCGCRMHGWRKKESGVEPPQSKEGKERKRRQAAAVQRKEAPLATDLLHLPDEPPGVGEMRCTVDRNARSNSGS